MSFESKIYDEFKQYETYDNEYLSNEAIERVIIDLELKLANQFNKIMDIKNNIQELFLTLNKYSDEKIEAALNICKRISAGEIGKGQLPSIEKEYGKELMANALVLNDKMQEARIAHVYIKFYKDRLETFYKLRK